MPNINYKHNLEYHHHLSFSFYDGPFRLFINGSTNSLLRFTPLLFKTCFLTFKTPSLSTLSCWFSCLFDKFFNSFFLLFCSCLNNCFSNISCRDKYSLIEIFLIPTFGDFYADCWCWEWWIAFLYRESFFFTRLPFNLMKSICFEGKKRLIGLIFLDYFRILIPSETSILGDF